MATSNPGIVIKPPFGGQRCDLDRLDVPEGTAYQLRNWLKRGGRFMVRPGFTQLGSSLGACPVGMIQYDHHTLNRFTVIGVVDGWWSYDISSKAWVEITDPTNPLTGSESTHQLFRIFYKSNKAYIVGVNGHTDIPKCWDGETDYYDDVAGSPPKAKCMAVNNNRLILGNTYTTQPNIHQVDVSAFNDFEAGWGTVQTTNLMDTAGEIVEMRELGNLVTAIYKSDAIYVCTAVDALYPFSFELKCPDIKGPCSPRAIVSLPDGHLFMASDGSFWSFNGVNLSYLGDALQAHVRATADLGKLDRSFGFYDARTQEVWFLYRSRGLSEPDMGLIINLADMTVWPVSFTSLRLGTGYGAQLQEVSKIGDLYQTIGELTGPIKDWSHTYSRLLLADTTGQVMGEEGYMDMGDPIPIEMETGLVVQNPQQYYTITESEHYFPKTESSQEVAIQLGYSKDGEEPVYTAAKTVDVGVSGRKSMGHRLTARFFSVKMSADATQPIQWRLSIVGGVARGLR